MAHLVRIGGLLAVSLALVLATGCRRAPRTAALNNVPPGATNATVLISLDGFRADYITRPTAVRLRELAARGVRAERLIPAFPSKTFPNHYTIVTGLYPEHHGIVANTMRDERIGTTFTIGDTVIARDPRWWGGEPIWNTAERQGVRTAAFFWPGSDYAVNGRYPTYYTPYDGRIPNGTRVQRVLDWLTLPTAEAPRLVTLYFSTTDDVGHKHGPRTPQVDTAIAHVDSLIGALVDGLAARQLTDRVNLVVVSDHGMTEVDSTRIIRLDEYVNLADMEVVDWMPVTAVTPRPGKLSAVYQALRRVPHLQVFHKDSVPERFHYRANSRITPLVLLADEGWTISSTERLRVSGPPVGATHGYDNMLPSMGALFLAAGPDIQQGRVIGPVANVHVYPLLARLLGVRPAPHDGAADSLKITRWE
jgi:predicted AlkP superfamily pyrophosphatase or phosphodiesterase